MTAHTDRAHARLAPSAAHRWVACPGSIRLSAGIEEAPSVYAAEGTAAHEIAAHCLDTGFDADRFKGQIVDTSGKTAAEKFRHGQPNGTTTFPVDGDMVDSVQTYLDVAREIAQDSEDFEIEQRLDVSAFVEGIFGTGDFIAYRGDLQRVTICDFKHGRGVAVEVAENEQLLTYALAVARRYHNRGVREVELIIVQPRAPHRDGPVRRWVTDLVGLYDHAMTIQSAAEMAKRDDAPLVPGDHCKFCRAAAICPALQMEAAAIVGLKQIDGEVMGIDDPAKYEPAELAAKLRALPVVMNWCKRLEEFAHAEAVRGRMPPGYKLVAKRAVRKWKDEAAAAMQLGMLGVEDDVLFETKMRSPAQVEKDLPKGSRGVVGDLSAAVSSGTSLAVLSDPRPAVDPNDARGFEAVEIDER